MTLIALTSGSAEEAQMIAVFLHGHGMSPQDFLPFANALGLPVAYHLLLGPCELNDGGHAWWPRDPLYAEQRGDPIGHANRTAKRCPVYHRRYAERF